VGTGQTAVYALDALTGNKIWTYTTGGDTGAPSIAGGLVYVSSSDGNIYALNASTGFRTWTKEIGCNVWTSAAIAYGVLYVGSDDDNLYAIGSYTGPTVTVSTQPTTSPNFPEFPTLTIPLLIIVMATAGLLVYLKKQKH
jgi:outer membrane protein assembly factor BamB